ncbi:uncharacterized protein LOC131932330 [Physella acuta]|uniref:uncharacterized protein LOC131932330 n=1 Tax=Physella acuta TaxID=109671 RepID=UPI0027DB198A|nr:uncharacterized protein LOC131932330 [Physella acuta]
MSVLWLLVLCAVGASQASFLLTVTPHKIEAGITENVTVQCSFWGESALSRLEKITMIRIMRQSNSEAFEPIVEKRDNEDNVHVIGLDPSIYVTAHIGTVASSFIEITWPVASFDVFGHYRCDVLGFDLNQDPMNEKSPVISVTETNVTAYDVLELLLKDRVELKSYCDAEVAASEARLMAVINRMKTEQASNDLILENTLRAEISALRTDVNRLMETGVLQYWPEGTYALLMPQDGCPNNVGAIWTTGFRKFHTESTDRNYDHVSTVNHLRNPILERAGTNNFMYQHFCVSTTLSPGAAWPRGSYCINRKGDKCPSGFETGSVAWNEERTGSAAAVSGTLPDGTFAVGSAKIFYCCRNDSSPYDTVYLPTARPFYLYRFGGNCQEVVGMKVTAEEMTFDTDSTNTDAYDNEYHPDGQINDIQMQLCYYEEI